MNQQHEQAFLPGESNQAAVAAERLVAEVNRLWAEYDQAYVSCQEHWLDRNCCADSRIFQRLVFGPAEIEKCDPDPSELRRSMGSLREAGENCLVFFNSLLKRPAPEAGIIKNKLADEARLAQMAFDDAELRIGELSRSLNQEDGDIPSDAAQIFLSWDVGLKKLFMVQNLQRSAEADMPLRMPSLPLTADLS